MKVAVLGSGAWGTALAQVLVDNKHDVTIYGIVKSQVDPTKTYKLSLFPIDNISIRIESYYGYK